MSIWNALNPPFWEVMVARQLGSGAQHFRNLCDTTYLTTADPTWRRPIETPKEESANGLKLRPFFNGQFLAPNSIPALAR